MGKQEPLFPDPAAAIAVDASRAEPILWIRRLIVWAKPGEVVRDIELHRGLNIVWSPDPGEDDAAPGEAHGSGHGAGKTLFCRLLRYCLGEETFANGDLRHRIASALPEGLVGAEIILGSQAWSVIRPLGRTRRIVARPGSDVEELLSSGTTGTGLEPFLEAVKAALFPTDVDAYVAGGNPWRSWLLALAWLSRDQECRLGGVLDWRHPAADSGSPFSNAPKDQLLLAVRALLDAVGAAEMKTRSELERVTLQNEVRAKELAFLDTAVPRLRARVTSSLGLGPVALGGGPLAAAAIADAAARNLSQVEAEEPAPDDGGASSVRGELDEVVRQLAVVREQLRQTRGLEELRIEQIRVLRGERSKLSADDLKARLGGPLCPVCNVPIDKALADGCGLSHVFPDLEALAASKARADDQMAAHEQAIGLYRGQLREKESIEQSLMNRESQLTRDIEVIRQQALNARQEYRGRWLAAARVASESARFQELSAAREKARQEAGAGEEQVEQLRERLRAHRQRHAQVLRRFEALFRYVCEGLLGAGTECSLTLGRTKLTAEVRVGGMAMDSLKALAFDLAAMLMAIEGRAALPALLIHDSPREADLGLSHYHRLFRLVRDFGRLGQPPPFQYIVTTTTEPPRELRTPEFVVAELSGLAERDRLLRRDL